MSARVVVSFRAPGGRGRTFLERARALEARASVRGGLLVAWDARRISFAFDADALKSALGLATKHGEDTADGERAFRVGVARGELEPLSIEGAFGELAWGPALEASTTLSGRARPGEVLVTDDLAAECEAELLPPRVEGAVWSAGLRASPGPREADRGGDAGAESVAELLSRMRVAPRVGGIVDASPLAAGALAVVRTSPGGGGSRWLGDLAPSTSAALHVTPSGASLEPLGALRRALARSVSRAFSPSLARLAVPLEDLLAGRGVSASDAAEIIVAALESPATSSGPPTILVDDAAAVDVATLEACAMAVSRASRHVAIVARVGRSSVVPPPLAVLPLFAEVFLERLGSSEAEELAEGVFGGALSPRAARRWARLGRRAPLAIVEALTHDLARGRLVWTGEHASPRSKTAGAGRTRAAAEWIRLRAREEPAPHRAVLALVAILGGEANATMLTSVLGALSGVVVDVDHSLDDLVASRWLIDTDDGRMALPSRTHTRVLAGLVHDSLRAEMHAVVADVIEVGGAPLALAEAAHHASRAGDRARAARLLVDVVERARALGLETSAVRLASLAAAFEPPRASPRPHVPSSPPTTQDVAPDPDVSEHTLVMDVSAAVAGAPFAALVAEVDDAWDVAPGTESEPDDVTIPGTPSPVRAEQVEGWLEDLASSPVSANPLVAQRLRALARAGVAEMANTLKALRRTRSALSPADHVGGCQTSLAIGVALAASGRLQEALIEGMEALSRARRGGDDRGARACLAFLAKLYASRGLPEAGALRLAATAASVQPAPRVVVSTSTGV